MTTKSWNELSNMFSEVLSSTLDAASAESVMTAWNSRRSEVTKLMGKTARTKRKKDPNAPKKWNTSYILFCNDMRERVKRENPELSANEIISHLASKWNELSEKEWKKYDEASKKDRARYDREMTTYTPPPQEETEQKGKRKVKKERTGPKRPTAAYLYFCTDAREVVKAENPNMTGKETISELGARWKALTDEQKAPYLEKQAEDKARYEAEKAELAGQTNQATSSAKSKPVQAPAKVQAKSKPAKVAPVQAPVQPPAKPQPKGKPVQAPVQAVQPPAKKSVPKKPDSKRTPGFEYFEAEQLEDLEQEYPDWNSKKRQTEVANRWKSLSASDREEYEAEARRAQEEEGSEVELEDE